MGDHAKGGSSDRAGGYGKSGGAHTGKGGAHKKSGGWCGLLALGMLAGTGALLYGAAQVIAHAVG